LVCQYRSLFKLSVVTLCCFFLYSSSLCSLADSKADKDQGVLESNDAKPEPFFLNTYFDKTIGLESFKGKKRVAIVFSPLGSESAGAKFIRDVKLHLHPIQEKDAVILILVNEKSPLAKELSDDTIMVLHDTDELTFQKYHASRMRNNCVLVGKDGLVKSRMNIVPPLDKLVDQLEDLKSKETQG
jgi:hypothetical protein